MTTAQSEAIRKVRDILGEHFDAHVICVQGEAGDDGKSEFNDTSYGGGYATAIGLLEVAKMHIWEKVYQKPKDDPEDQP